MAPDDRPLFADSDANVGTLVKEPQQARSRRTLARILQASLDLLETDGPDALTVTRITKKAKSSVGSFYARFDGKEDLVRYVGEHALGEALSAWDELIRGTNQTTDTVGACDELVRGLGQILARGPGLPLVLLDGLEESDRARMRRFEDEVASGLRELAGSDVGARVASMALTSVLSQAARDLGPSGRERLTDELVRLVAGYFGAALPEAPAQEMPIGDTSPDETESDREQEAPSPWDLAAGELIGSGVTAPTEPVTEDEPEPEPEIPPEDDLVELEEALRDLGAELDDSEALEEVEEVPEDEDESPVDADPFDVWA